ncbi:MAG: PHP domain-containing protein [Bacteroidales bacterium]
MRADLHIHTVLSPCGDIEMSPVAIINKAKEKSLDIIGITDHNSTRMAPIIRDLGDREGVYVLCGAEVTTREEVHVLAFVDGNNALSLLQEYLNRYLIRIPNNPDVFGYQLVVNENEEVLYQEESLLIGTIEQSLDQVEEFVHSLGGIFIPAHIDKKSNSLLSQLGFLPPGLNVDALELSARCVVKSFLNEYSYLSNNNFICSSDAHYVKDIGKCFTLLDVKNFSFEAVKEAIKKSGVNNLIYH